MFLPSAGLASARTAGPADGAAAPPAHAFVLLGSFAAADAAIKALDGRLLRDCPMHVEYAIKAGARSAADRHGSDAERLLERERRKRAEEEAEERRLIAQLEAQYRTKLDHGGR